MSETKKRLLIIDANSLIHRAFHALPPLTTAKGEMVNAVYGFLLVLFKVIKEFKPEYIAACFDAPGPTKREEKFKEYKATRPKAPEELYEQIPKVQQLLSVLNIPIFAKRGYEADDLIATITNYASKRQVYPSLEVIILSGDLDTLQLVDDNTKVYTLRKGIQDTVLYDSKAVENRFGGLTPQQLRDYKGLRGDPSDNIPGVKGIGEKTAIFLLNKFGSLETLYQKLKSKDPTTFSLKKTLSETLLQSQDQVFFSRELASLDKNVPLKLQVKDLAWGKFDEKKVREILEELEFKSLLPRLSELQRVPSKEPPSKIPTKDYPKATLARIERLYKEGVFSRTVYELEKRLISVISAMEDTGIKIDRQYFRQLSLELKEALEEQKKKIFQLVGITFNVNSPRQLSDILFLKLKLPTKGIQKTPGGEISTASLELEKLQGIHPVIQEILIFRELAKTLSTYVDPLLLLADSKDRIHAHFDQLGTATGRISCTNPNLQNIPLKGVWGIKIRKGFVAENSFSFVSFDYSQQELRVASHIAKEPRLQKFFEDQQDIHIMTACEVFGVPSEKVTESMRYRAKALNFGIMYGMGPQGFAQASGLSLKEAQEFINRYFLRFPKIKEYIDKTIAFASKYGYVETLFGRRRYLPDINSSTPSIRSAAERAAINHPIQGTSADLMKMAMVKIYEHFASKNSKVRMLLQIHDELLLEIQDDILNETILGIKRTMEGIYKLAVPLLVEVKVGKNWAETTKQNLQAL